MDMKAERRAAKGLFRKGRDFLWPPRSLVSGERGQGQGPLSPDEFRQIRFITDPVCNRCGVPQDFDVGPETECPACMARPPRWNRARAALVYDDLSRRPVLDLKRSGRRDGLETLAGWMIAAGGGADCCSRPDRSRTASLHPPRHARLQPVSLAGSGDQAGDRDGGCRRCFEANAAYTEPGGPFDARAAAECLRRLFRAARRAETYRRGACAAG